MVKIGIKKIRSDILKKDQIKEKNRLNENWEMGMR